MRIYYKTGTGSEIINLDQPPYWMQTGDFLDYVWEYEISGRHIGKLRKTVQEKEFTITVFGKTEEEYAHNINTLHQAFERDVLKNTPGRLYFGEYYLSCFVYTSEKTEWEYGCNSMDNTLGIIEANSFWRRETTHRYLPQQKPVEGDVQNPDISGEKLEGELLGHGAVVKDFPFDFLKPSNLKITYPLFGFPFDLVGTHGRRTLNNEAFTDTDFVMIIYGFVDNPNIQIAGHPYTVYATVYEGERLIIDSAAGTVKKIGRLGEETDLYNARRKDYSVFQKIPPGVQTVSWPGTYGVDIILYDERSEPKWSL